MADKVRAVVVGALQPPIAQRPASRDRACAGDDEVRRRVEALLRAHDGPDQLLDRPAWSPPPEPDRTPPPADGPLERAGRIHLLGEIARGGMGTGLRGHDPRPGRQVAVTGLPP